MTWRTMRFLRQARAAAGLMWTGYEKGVHVSFRNRGGSVQHYYHFVLGFLVPLVAGWDGFLAQSAGGRVYVRSCAVMDPLLAAMGRDELAVLTPERHAALARIGRDMIRLERPGYDHPSAYDAAVFGTVRTTVAEWLAPEVAAQAETVAGLFGNQGPRVLIIDRLPADPFYGSRASEVRTSGSQRRSLANVAELHAVAQARFGGAALVTLERRSLAFQMAVFHAADVIICQHGAALANLLWARPGTTVIEIMPAPMIAGGRMPDYFGGLAACLGMPHRRILQPTEHSPVDPDALARALEQADDAR